MSVAWEEEAATLLEARTTDATAWLSIPQAATYLNVSEHSARRLCASGALRSKLFGRLRRVSREALAEFIEDAPE